MRNKQTKRRTTPPQLAARVKALQKRIRQWKVSALLLTRPVDIRYLTNFIGEDSWALVPARGSSVHILSDFRFVVELQQDSSHTVHHIHKKGLVSELADLKDKLGLKRIGLQPAHVSVALRKTLDKKLGVRRFKNVKDGLLAQRAIKDKKEIALLQKACDIQQTAMRRLLKQIKPGMTELQIKAKLHYEMVMLGATDAGFDTIIAADANAAMCHATAGQTKVKRGGIVLIDWGARYQGYHSDMTRTYALGRMPQKIREIYKIVLDAQQAAFELVKPGARYRDLDAAARGLITKAGYGEEFGHSLGHGIGLEIHEEPGLGSRAKGVLEPGQVITLEPGIYLPGVGGVRIEDDVLVTARGKRWMTSLPKSLESAIIG